jgi:GT2 family glycosyltransferase
MSPIGITVVIPTLDRASFLKDTLSDLLKQQYGLFEILVVDQSEKKPEFLNNQIYKNDLLRYERVDFKSLPKARNYGWQHARYEVVVYLDDDIRCGPNLLMQHGRAIEFPSVGIVAGGIDEVNNRYPEFKKAGYFNRLTATPTRGFDSFGEFDVDLAPGGNFSVWKRICEECGGIDELFECGAALYEESDFSLRVKKKGYRVFFNGNARITHLAAGAGGCRTPHIPTYVRNLARNRTMMILRHCPVWSYPVAFSVLLKLCMAYTVHYRQPAAVPGLVKGILEGADAARMKPVCTRFGREFMPASQANKSHA